MKDYLYPLRVLHGKLHDRWVRIKNNLRFYRELLLPFGKRVFLIGTPTHPNIGDSAIVLAEMIFLERYACCSDRIKELTERDVAKHNKLILQCIQNGHQSVICWHGGGNMGDQWFNHELFRRKWIPELQDKSMILFPQTIYYTPTDKGKQEEAASIPIYNGRPGLTLVAREQKSYQKMKELYPDTQVLLTPDIVLSCTMEDFGVSLQRREDVLLCVRSDAEKTVGDDVWEELRKCVVSIGESVRQTDMYASEAVTKENRTERVRAKMLEFCSAKLVITDRLHGMIFAAITGTPCIVFSNYNHKVKGTYDWIRYLPYIRYVETLDEAKKAIPELLTMNNCHFDNTPLKPYYDPLAEVVKEKCR